MSESITAMLIHVGTRECVGAIAKGGAVGLKLLEEQNTKDLLEEVSK